MKRVERPREMMEKRKVWRRRCRQCRRLPSWFRFASATAAAWSIKICFPLETSWLSCSCFGKHQKCFQLQCSLPFLACFCSHLCCHSCTLLCASEVQTPHTIIDTFTILLPRVLLILWGTNKFLKKLIKPWAINNNELVDFISRVPDNEELVIAAMKHCWIFMNLDFLEKLQRDYSSRWDRQENFGQDEEECSKRCWHHLNLSFYSFIVHWDIFYFHYLINHSSALKTSLILDIYRYQSICLTLWIKG